MGPRRNLPEHSRLARIVRLPRLPVRVRRGTVGAMNTDPKIRVVGRRKPSNYHSGGLKAADGFLKMVNVLRAGQPFIPCGVYRFKTHEELDAWTMKMLTRPKGEPRK